MDLPKTVVKKSIPNAVFPLVVAMLALGGWAVVPVLAQIKGPAGIADTSWNPETYIEVLRGQPLDIEVKITNRLDKNLPIYQPLHIEVSNDRQSWVPYEPEESSFGHGPDPVDLSPGQSTSIKRVLLLAEDTSKKEVAESLLFSKAGNYWVRASVQYPRGEQSTLVAVTVKEPVGDDKKAFESLYLNRSLLLLIQFTDTAMGIEAAVTTNASAEFKIFAKIHQHVDDCDWSDGWRRVEELDAKHPQSPYGKAAAKLLAARAVARELRAKRERKMEARKRSVEAPEPMDVVLERLTRDGYDWRGTIRGHMTEYKVEVSPLEDFEPPHADSKTKAKWKQDVADAVDRFTRKYGVTNTPEELAKKLKIYEAQELEESRVEAAKSKERMAIRTSAYASLEKSYPQAYKELMGKLEQVNVEQSTGKMTLQERGDTAAGLWRRFFEQNRKTPEWTRYEVMLGGETNK